MVKKLEFAVPFFYCDLAKACEEKNTECIMNPEPNCRSCSYRKEFNALPNSEIILAKYRAYGKAVQINSDAIGNFSYFYPDCANEICEICTERFNNKCPEHSESI